MGWHIQKHQSWLYRSQEVQADIYVQNKYMSKTGNKLSWYGEQTWMTRVLLLPCTDYIWYCLQLVPTCWSTSHPIQPVEEVASSIANWTGGSWCHWWGCVRFGKFCIRSDFLSRDHYILHIRIRKNMIALINLEMYVMYACILIQVRMRKLQVHVCMEGHGWYGYDVTIEHIRKYLSMYIYI